jgi:WD40 repeat protein
MLAGLLALAAAAPAQEPPRLDGDGDRLPTGAVYRLGTKAWRHTGNASSPSWSADGKRLAMLCSYREVRVLDGETGKAVAEFHPTDDAGAALSQCYGVVLSPNGEEVAVRTMPATIHFFDAATGKRLRRWVLKSEDFGDNQVALRYSPSGKHLAAGFQQTYQLLDVKSGEPVIQGKLEKGQLRGLAFTADGKRLVVLATSPGVQVWDLEKREVVKRSAGNRPEDHQRGTSVSSDGRYIVSGGQEVVVLDFDNDAEAARLTSDDGGHFVETAFTPDDKLLLAATQQGTIHVWSTGDWQQKWKLVSGAYFSRGLAVRPGGRHAALTDARSRVWLWDLATGKPLADDRAAHDAGVYAVAFSPRGDTLATGSDGQDTHLWDAATGQHRRHIETSSRKLHFNRGGTQLVTSWNVAPHLRIWDLAGDAPPREWNADEPNVYATALSADESHVAALVYLNQQATFRVQRLTFPGLKPAGQIERRGYMRGSLAISADGRIAAVPTQTNLELYDLAAQTVIAEVAEPTQLTDAIAFTPDERFLIAPAADNTIKVWELASCRLAHVLEGHKQMVFALALSRDGRVLVTADGATGAAAAGADAPQIHFWDLAAGGRLASLAGHDQAVASLALSPDGKRLASGLRDTTAIVWDVPKAAQNGAFANAPLPAADAAALWDELESSDAKAATAAIVRLAQDPAQAVALSEQRISPARPVDEQVLAELIRQLDAEEFTDRRAAFDKLAAYGAVIAPRLKATVARAESGEVKLRCGELLNLMQKRFPLPPARLAETRAVQLLEWIGDERATAHLTKLAGGSTEAHLTREAQAAMERLTK